MKFLHIALFCSIFFEIVFASSVKDNFSFCRTEATLSNHGILVFSDNISKEKILKLIDHKCSFSIEGVTKPAGLINSIENTIKDKKMSSRVYLQGRGEKLLHIVYDFVAKIAKIGFGLLIVFLGWIYHALAQFGFIGIIIGGLICLGLGIQLGAGILLLWGGSLVFSSIVIYICIGVHNLFTLNPDYLIEKDFSKQSMIRVMYTQNMHESKYVGKSLFEEMKIDLQNIGLDLQKTFLSNQ